VPVREHQPPSSREIARLAHRVSVERLSATAPPGPTQVNSPPLGSVEQEAEHLFDHVHHLVINRSAVLQQSEDGDASQVFHRCQLVSRSPDEPGWILMRDG